MSDLTWGELRNLRKVLSDEADLLDKDAKRREQSPTPTNTGVAYGYREAANRIRRALRAGCPTCSGPVRETVGMVCQTCGTDYGRSGGGSS